MAILYTSEMTASGITYGRRRGYINYTVSHTSTTTTVTVTDMGVAYYTSEWSDTYYYGATGTISATCGGTSLGSKTVPAATVYCTTSYKLVSVGAGGTVNFTRGSSDATKTLSVTFATSFATNSPVTGSINITVPKTATTYYLNYDANGGWAEPEPLPYTLNGTAIVNLSNQPARMGYQFLYWTTNKDGSGTIYYPGSSWDTSKKGGTIYAQWTEGIPLSKTRKFIYIDGDWYPIEKTYVYNNGWQDVIDESRLYSGSWLYT